MLLLILAMPLMACNFNTWLSQLGVYSAWNHGIYGDGVTIGVIDSGANLTVLKEIFGNDVDVQVISVSYLVHKTECIGEAVFEGKKYCVLENITTPWGYRLKLVPLTPTDDLGHGTAVTSIILSIAPHSRVIVTNAAITILDVNYYGKVVNKSVLLNPESVVRAFEYLYHHGVDVINLSLGVPFDEVENVSDLLSEISNLNVSNVTIVASVGNEGLDTPSPISLEGDVIAVGALDNMAVANFSNTGIGVDFVAPGTSLCLPVPSDSVIAMRYGERVEGNVTWTYLSGTSCSTAMVSGLAALWIQATGAVGSSEVRCVMRYRVIDLGKKGWDPQTGYGIPLAPDGYYEPCKTAKYSLALLAPPAFYKIFAKSHRRSNREHH